MSSFHPVVAAAVLVAAVAQGASAQESYATAVTLGFNSYDGDRGLDANGGTLQVETDLSFGALTLDVDLGYDRLSDDGDDLSNFSTEILPKYWFTPSVGGGLYLARDSVDLGSGDVENLDSYGLEGTYRAPGFESSVFVGRTRVDVLADDIDVTDFGVRVRFDLSPQFALFGNGVHSNFDAGGADGTASSYGIGAQYGFANGLSVYGGYQNTSAENLDGDLDTTSLGVNYGLNAGGRPIILSGEYARLNGDTLIGDVEADRLSVSATILLGDAQSKRISGNAVTGSLLKSDRNAISGILSAIGL